MFHNQTWQLILPFIDKHFAKAYGNPKEHRLNFNLDELKKGEKHDITYTFEDHLDTRVE